MVLNLEIVTNEHGLVGKIVKVYESISIVLPIRHVSAKTIGRIKEQGSLVLISGRHFKGGVIDYISNNVGLEKNQQILSIIDGLSMPAGIPIGTIVNPYERPIQVKLNVDFSLLDYVTIIRNNKTKYNTSEQTDIFEQKSSQKNQDNSQNISGKKNKSINQDQGH